MTPVLGRWAWTRSICRSRIVRRSRGGGRDEPPVAADTDDFDVLGTQRRDQLVLPGEHVGHRVVEGPAVPEGGRFGDQSLGTTDPQALDENEDSGLQPGRPPVRPGVGREIGTVSPRRSDGASPGRTASPPSEDIGDLLRRDQGGRHVARPGLAEGESSVGMRSTTISASCLIDTVSSATVLNTWALTSDRAAIRRRGRCPRCVN